jgi:hypothetical protein
VLKQRGLFKSLNPVLNIPLTLNNSLFAMHYNYLLGMIITTNSDCSLNNIKRIVSIMADVDVYCPVRNKFPIYIYINVSKFLHYMHKRLLHDVYGENIIPNS